MAKVIIIQHQSEIIRTGIKAILENNINTRINCICNFSELEQSEYDRFTEAVIILSDNKTDSENLLVLRKMISSHILIGIIDNEKEQISPDYFDYTYNINSPVQNLLNKINSFLNDENKSDLSDELTRREKEVLRLVALGFTNKSIADTLYISIHTVISHRKKITEKLGIKSIPGLTIYAIIQKIISQSDISEGQLQ